LIVRHKQESWGEILPSGGGILQQERLCRSWILTSFHSLVVIWRDPYGFKIVWYYLQLYKREQSNLLVRKSNWKVGFGWSLHREHGGGAGPSRVTRGAGAGHTKLYFQNRFGILWSRLWKVRSTVAYSCFQDSNILVGKWQILQLLLS
jgi:hypothetical protein